MAKLKAPLLSFGASGQLAKSIVFFPWKGVDAVREYVIPANPRSEAQRAQRLHMTNALAEWHGAAYYADDVIAWNRFAGTLAKIMSGFNAMVRTFIDEAILDNTWERLNWGTVHGVTTTGMQITISKESAGNAPTVHYGTRKTHFPNSATMVDLTGDRWRSILAGLTKATLYYFYIDVGTTATDYGRTGIYQQRTAAA